VTRSGDIDEIQPAERRRRPAEQVVEDVDQHDAGEEGRQGHARRHQHPAEVVDPGPGPHRRQHAQRNGDETGQQQRGQRQLQRRGQPRGEVGQHRLPGGQRQAQIAAQQVAHVDEELLTSGLSSPSASRTSSMDCSSAMAPAK
jgi:hypothetical protein